MWVSILITLDFENDKIWVGMYLILEYKGLTLHSSENSADSSKLQGTEL